MELSSYGKGGTPVQRVKEKFKKCPDGRLRNERLEAERQKQAEFRAKQAENGRKGGRPHKKGLGYSGLSQTKAKKSSPSPSPSPSPLSDPSFHSLHEREQKGGFEKPTIEQVRLLAHKAGLPTAEADKFFYHYDSKGWKVGREPMRSLNSALGGWAVRWRQNGNHTPAQSGGFD